MFPHNFRLPIAVIAAALVSTVVLSACGSGGGTSATAPQTTAGGAATLGVAGNSSLGRILVDSHGRTLYLFQRDKGPRSRCVASCAVSWPPLRASRRPVVGRGLTASSVGTTPRPDGAQQITYHGHPLYLFAGDQRPGETNGQGSTAFGGRWFALSPSGAVKGSAPSGGVGGY